MTPANNSNPDASPSLAERPPVDPSDDPAAVVDGTTLNRLARIREVLDDLKASETVQIDLAGRSSLADFILITTATSATHAKAIVDELQTRLKQEKIRPHHVEPDEGRTWIVVDYGDVVVHVFQGEQRRYYDLEGLWNVEGYPRRNHSRYEPARSLEIRDSKPSLRMGPRRGGPLVSRGFRPKPPKIFKP